MTRHRFSREELYELVWSEPMSRLSKRLGVSDRGLAKVCARANIPVPSRGYWARLQHGQTVDREPLPQPESGLASTVEITPGPQRLLLSELSPEILELVRKESSPELRITVSKTLSNPHPLVRSWLEQDREWPLCGDCTPDFSRSDPHGPHRG